MRKIKNTVKTKEEDVQKSSGISDVEALDKAQNLLAHPEMYADQPPEIQEEIKKLSQDYIDEHKEKPEIKPEPVKPKFKIKARTEEKPLSVKAKTTVTPEQLNMLTYALAQGVCISLKKEDMKPDETMMFSQTLYEVGMANGWFDNISFLPYLVLIGAGVELTMKIIQKPSKIKNGNSGIITPVEDKVINKLSPEPTPVMENKDFGKVDLIDSDKLVAKLGGGKVYKNAGVIDHE